MSTTFINWIIEGMWDVADWFYDGYQTATDWIYPFSLISAVLFHLYDTFADVAVSFGYFGFWILDISDKIQAMFTFDNVYYYLKSYLDAAINSWAWVENSYFNVWDIVDVWWTVASVTVSNMIDALQSWTEQQVSYMETALNELQARLDNFTFELPDLSLLLTWFSDWQGNLWTFISGWWNTELPSISCLITDAFTLRDDYWRGWQEARDEILAFFSDPCQWVYDKLDEFFERFW